MHSCDRESTYMAIPQQSVDQDFNVYFQAKDRFANIVPITQELESKLETAIELSQSNVKFTQQA